VVIHTEPAASGNWALATAQFPEGAVSTSVTGRAGAGPVKIFGAEEELWQKPLSIARA
jgi:hypothetical protein